MVLSKLFGTKSDREVKKLAPTIGQINQMYESLSSKSDDELVVRTEELRDFVINTRKEKVDSLPEGMDRQEREGAILKAEQGALGLIMVESFAMVKETCRRMCGSSWRVSGLETSWEMIPYDEQLMGAITLHNGKVSEMKTGEGKTLVATLPAYLNALTGLGVHVVTVNDYLARRDAQWMGSVYHKLGLTVGVLQHESAYIYDPSPINPDIGMEQLSRVGRSEAYGADITYGTNNEFGFDYLRDNMVIDKSQRVQRELNHAIVDEVDNILIDEARTPLIISGPGEKPPSEYQKFSKLVPNLKPEIDYTIEEKHKAVSLTAEGITNIESSLRLENLYAPSNFETVHLIENALKAKAIFTKDQEYVVRNGEVIIVDEFTGRLMQGRRYSDGLHQALEAKEGVRIQRESITYATITLQNYFRLYSKLSGMTGTAETEAEEFHKIYKLEVVAIPTNKPMVRIDHPDLVFKDQNAKLKAVVTEIESFEVERPLKTEISLNTTQNPLWHPLIT